MKQSHDGPMIGWTVTQLLDELAAHTPTPGGGTVAALTGALCCALGRMVASYGSRGESEQDKARRLEYAVRLERADMALRHLIDEDARAYAQYDQLRKDRRDNKCSDADMQNALLVCAMVPLEVGAVACAALDVLGELASCTSRYLHSDLCAAAILAEATVRCAGCSVRVNLKAMADRESAASLAEKLETLETRASQRLAGIDSVG